jgi:hypothetical protein
VSRYGLPHPVRSPGGAQSIGQPGSALDNAVIEVEGGAASGLRNSFWQPAKRQQTMNGIRHPQVSAVLAEIQVFPRSGLTGVRGLHLDTACTPAL